MSEELYKKYRPSKLAEVIGQDSAVATLREMGRAKKLPHVLLFSGPSGTGKTTLARILAKLLKCGDTDYEEKNAANASGIDAIRDIERVMNLSPVSGPVRVWTLDEAHQLTSQGQSCLLKMLEDTPSHVYFFLATTHPGKLQSAIRTRCTEIALSPIPPADIGKLLTTVAEKEKLSVAEDVTDKIVQVADGSARKALVLLHQVASLSSEKEMLAAIEKSDPNKVGVDLARALIGKSQWPAVSAILKAMEMEAEAVRRIVLAYCYKVMLGGGAKASQAFIVVDSFSSNFYDSGNAGLAAACWEVVHGVE